MDKAIEILSDWVRKTEQYLGILIERRDVQKHWSEAEGKSDFYTPRYLETKLQVETLERGISEVENALKLLTPCIDPTESPSVAAADTSSLRRYKSE